MTTGRRQTRRQRRRSVMTSVIGVGFVALTALLVASAVGGLADDDSFVVLGLAFVGYLVAGVLVAVYVPRRQS